jgi:exodeoxyribonuclease V alpha subunit
MTPDDGLEPLRARGLLSPLDVHFARTLARLADERDAAVALGAALVSRQVGQGHVCLDLHRLGAGAVLIDDQGAPVPAEQWPPHGAWLAALRASALVGGPEADAPLRPLVLDGEGRLYLRRYWDYQRRLAAAIGARAAAPDAEVDAGVLARGLARLFPDGAATPDWQRVAACAAVQRRFCVISGGPGTGKTFTVVKILALLVEQAFAAGRPPPRMTLLAPTGKAAARLGEAIQRAKGGLAVAATVRAAIPDEPATIHRGLGARRGRPGFLHHAGEPLLTDVVLVDEASMVDLALMARLVDAMPAAARLILLGDQDQLASVEAGAVLGDICNAGAARTYSHAFADSVQALSGDRLPVAADAPGRTGIWDGIVQLTHSYRYRPESGIGELARAINAGDAEGALAVLARSGDVSRCDPGPPEALGDALLERLAGGLAPYVRSQGAARLAALDGFRLLCAHRRGPYGAEVVNELVERRLAADGVIRPGEPFYIGRPIMVTRNDYQLGLFNGDVGLIVDDPARPGGRAALFVFADGRVRLVAPARLPPCDTVFAMTIHKSQGSEFDEVAVLLPALASPIVSRELLYTAVTRARRRVTIHASRDVIARAVGQRIERASGLRQLLWGSRATPAPPTRVRAAP